MSSKRESRKTREPSSLWNMAHRGAGVMPRVGMLELFSIKIKITASLTVCW
jgi:hypothetical protein